MTRPRVRSSRLHAAVLAGAAAVLVAAACETPHPTQIAPATSATLYRADDGEEGLETGRPEIRVLVERHFPAVLTRGMEGASTLAFVIDGQGRVVEAQALEAPATRVRPSREPGAGGRAEETAVVVAAASARAGMEPALLERVDPDDIESIEVGVHAPGRLGPDRVQVVLVQLKGDYTPRSAAAGGGTRVRVPGSAGSRQQAARLALAAPAGDTVPVRDGDGGARIRIRGAGAPASAGATAQQGARIRVRGDGQAPAVEVTQLVDAPSDTLPQAARLAEIRAAMARHYPDAVRTPLPSGRPVYFIVDGQGRVVSTGADLQGQVEPERVESIEVLKGPQVPGAPGGVVWIRLKP